MKKVIFLSQLFLIGSQIGICQSSSKDSLIWYPVQTNEKIEIDGKLSEHSWLNTKVIDQFITVEPQEGNPAKFKTEVRVLTDHDNVYFGIVCYDSELKSSLRITTLERDFSDKENENIVIIFDPELKSNVVTIFGVTPYGNKLDGEVYDYGLSANLNWNTTFSVKTQIKDSLWIAEFAIPFKTLRYHYDKKVPFKNMGLKIYRVARRENEVSSIPASERQFPKFRLNKSALLKDLHVPKPSSNIQIRPYSLIQYDNIVSEKTDLTKAKIGLDVKWAINPNKILDLSINTDFAQVEADQTVVNLSQQSILLPEKRQFFLENSSVFQYGSDVTFLPFNSRTIGLDQNGFQIPIHYGLRYFQNSHKTNLGMMIIQQRDEWNGKKYNSQIAVFSIKNKINENHNLSFMSTLKTAIKDRPDHYLPNGTATFDYAYGKNAIAAGANVSISNDFNTSLSSGVGSNEFIQVDKKQYWLLFAHYLIAKNYNPALGFLTWPNSSEHFLGFDKNIWPKKNWPKNIRFINPGVELDYYFSSDTYKPLSYQSRFIPLRINFINGSSISNYQLFITEFINQTFNPLNAIIEPGKYTFWYNSLLYNSDPSKKLSVDIKERFGEFYNGHFQRFTSVIKYRPLPNLSLISDISYTTFYKVGSTRINSGSVLWTPGINLSINPTLHIKAFYQLNSLSKTERLNARFEWEYKPLSYLFLVFNDFKDDIERFHQNQSIAKINFLYQF